MKSLFSMIMVFLCLFGLTINNTFAQIESDVVTQHEVVVTMKNGEVFKGVIVKTDAEKMTIASENGEVHLLMAQVDEIEIIEQDINDEILDESDINRSRYFLTSSTIPLEKSKGYYTNQALFLNRFGYGISKNLSIESGFFFSPFGKGTFMGYLAPKASFKFDDKGYIGVGAYVLRSPNADNISLFYGKTTFGDTHSNVSFGLGLLNLDKTSSTIPVISIDFAHKIDSNITIVSENVFTRNKYINNDKLLLFGMHGVRYSKKHHVFDMGVTSMLGSQNTPILMIPQFSYSMNF